MKDFLDGDCYRFKLENCAFPHDTLGNLTSGDKMQWKCCIYYASFYSLALTLGLVMPYKAVVIYSWNQPRYILNVRSFYLGFV